jgi:uncharacterized repeat protein (TIGR01451 family)
MRRGSKIVSSLDRVKSIGMVTLLVLGTMVLAVSLPGEEPADIPAWPAESEWINYTFRGERIRDWEDKPYENDPTHGIANVQPAAVDIASGVDASGGGADNNPGNYTSVQYVYKDFDGDSSGCNNLDDDWLFLRQRVAGDPRHGGKYAYKSYHWDILVEVDGDIWSEFVVDLNGGDGYFKFGTVGVFYNNTEDYEYDPDNDWVWLQEASKNKNKFTNPRPIDYGTATEDDDQWWVEYRVPVTAFTDLEDNQLLCYDTDFLLFFSTSASMTNPLQKDWMGEYVFGEPANITVVKTVEEGIVAPGDTLHYKIYYNNTGDFNANDVWVNDTIPEFTTFQSCYPNYDSVSGRTYRWHFTDVEPGNHTIYLNVTVNNDVPDGTILRNVVVLNYTDNKDNEQPGSEDETENPVEGPTMVLTKEADKAIADPGDVIHYTITYENTGSGGAYNVTINDTIPADTTFDSCYPSYDSVSGDTYTWVIDNVAGKTTGEILLNVTVDAYTTDGTVLVNYVTLDYADVNGNDYPRLHAWANVTVTAPLMDVTKTADVSSADPGDPITYTITYENTGTGNATDVEIRDTIPEYTTFVSSNPTHDDQEGLTYIWNFAVIEGGDSGTITITVKVNVSTPDTTVLTNLVTLDYDDANGNPYPQESDTADVTVTAPVLTLEKTADVTKANPGDQIIYTIRYENTGTGKATNVYINDTIPDHTTLVTTSKPYDSVSGRTYTWKIGDVCAGCNETFTITVKVDAGTADGTVLVNLATLDYSDTNGNPYPQLKDWANVTVTAPVMTITKSADKSTANPGDEITYTVTYENTGTGDASDVVVKDTIPDDTEFVSSSPGYDSVSGKTYTWNVGTVLAGKSGTITITVKVKAGTEDETILVNKATLYYEDVNGNPYPTQSAWANVTVTAPIMTVSKTASVLTADPGDEINYTITYENIGTGLAKNVKIVDTLPLDVNFVVSYPMYDSVSGNVYTWNVGDVAAGDGDDIYVVVTVKAGTQDGSVLRNYVKLTYTDANNNPLPEENDYVDVTVTAPEMTITKTADNDYADPGDEVTYTLFYENTGSGDATGVVVKDTIPDETDFVSCSPAYDSVSGRTYTWNVGDVASGENGTITITVKVKAYTPDKEVITNWATLDYKDANGNPLPQDSDSADVTITAPEMTITKVANVFYADPGDEIEYTITYVNSGTGVATDVVIKDTIPSDTEFVSANPTYDSVSGDTYTWNIGNVAGGGSGGSITLVVKVKAGTPDKTVLTNNVTLDYDDANGNPQDQESDSVDVTVTAPVMTVTKTANVSTADPSDEITYTIEYKNNGTGNATNVKIVDTIPADTTAVSATPTWDSVSGDDYTWNIGNVAAGGFGSITLVVKVDVGTGDGTLLKNWVTLSYADANGNSLPDETDYADVIVTAPVMTITKSADVSTADPDDKITYTLDYENSGSGEATNVYINDTIPADTTFVSANPMYTSVSGSTYTWFFASVAAKSSDSIELVVKVKVGTDDGTLLRNMVTLDYSDANGNPYPQETDYVDVLVTAPVFTFYKTADVTKADPGDWINYTIYYKNTGSGNATNVVITDTIPADTTLKSTDPAYDSSSGDTYTWNIGTVAAGKEGKITVTVTVDAYTADGTLLRNTATLDYSDANGNPYPQMDDYADVTVTAPEMTVTKVANVDKADPSDEIEYTITYHNSGSGTATDVVIEDTIPSDTEFVSANPMYDSVSGNTYTWNIGDVAGGDGGSIKLVVKVKVGTPDKTVLTNNVTLDYDDANGNPQDQESDIAVVTVTAPVMSVTKTANVSTADPSDGITYTIVYKNTGTGEATNVYINDTIPADTTFVSSNPAYDSVSGDTYTWFFPSVGAGKGGNITLVVKVDVGVADKTVLKNDVTLDYSDANGNPLPQESDSEDVTVTAPVFTFSKKANVPTADPGDEIIYTIEYENTGTGEATNVYINDTIPSEVVFVSSNPMYDSVSGNTYTWFFASVPAGTADKIEIKVKVKAGTEDKTVLRNDATLDYSDANGNPYPQMDDYAEVTVTAPEMSISKTANVATADPDDEITYTIEYKNTGTGNATNVYINDTIPTDTTFVSANPMYTSVSGNTYTWFFAVVAANSGGSIELVVKVKVGTGDGTVLKNDVTLDYSDANGNPLPQESDSVEVTVTAPVVTITKTADVDKADPDDEITYTLHYKNTGSGEATNVYINDTIPTDVVFVSASPMYTSVSGNTYTWIIASLPGYKEDNITLVVRVKVGTPDKTLLRNLVTLDFSDANGNPYPQEKDHADVVVTAPVMTVQKVASVSTADPSDFINYTITYENSGTGVATNVWINDTIPADTTFIESTPNYDSVSGDTYTWFFASVAAGFKGEIHIKVQVDVGTGDGTILRNDVTLDYADANGNPYDQQSDYVEVLVTAPVMNLTKTADVTHADPSDEITYTVTFKNSGSGNATKVYINDTIPADVDFVSSNPAYDSVSGRTYTWYFAIIEPNETVVIEIVVKVKAYTDDKTVLYNLATLDYCDDNGNPYATEKAWAEVTVTAPVLSIIKTANVDTADPDDEIEYTIFYENTGTGEATDLYINDTIPNDVTFVSSNPTYDSVSGNTYTWKVSSLGPGKNGTITIVVKVKVGTPDKTLLRNDVTLDYSDANGNPYPTLTDSADVRVTAPVMEFTKVADVSTADPDDEITYTITYKNVGTGDATNVKITDTIPNDVDFVSSTPMYDSVSGNTYTWNIGFLAAGDGGTINVTVKVKVGTPDKTLLHNEAVLYYADANGNAYTPIEDYADVRVTAPVMEFSKVASVTTADPGDQFTYTITYLNNGTGQATNVKITDTIPNDVVFVSSTPLYDSVSGNTYTWNIGTLDAGKGGTITITVKVKVGTPDTTLLRNEAVLYYADANGNDYTPMEDYADVTVTAPVMEFSKTVDVTTADPGDQFTYTITYQNVGTGDATQVRVVDTIPADTDFVSSTPLYDAGSGQTYVWLIGDLAAGKGGTIKITVKVKVGTPDKTLLRNVATLYYADANGNPYTPINDTADVRVTAPVMEFSKVASVTTADPGDQFTYTITVENTGTGDACCVWVNDTIPGDVVFVSSNPMYDSVSGNTYTWYFSWIYSGEKKEIEITVKVKVGTPDRTLLRNTATLDYSDANENPYNRMEDQADVRVTAPVMEFSKTVSVTEADPGDVFTYTITYQNVGTGNATNVKITDTIPADVDFVSSSPNYTSVSGDTYTWDIGFVAAGDGGTIKITVKVKVGTPDKTLLRNKAVLYYADANGNAYTPIEDYADVRVTAPVMRFSKVANVPTADPGDLIEYTLTYLNVGTGDATAVMVSDTIPEDVEYVSSSPVYTMVVNRTYIWNIGFVAAGDGDSITLTVRVKVGTPDKTLLENDATLYYADANGNQYTPIEDYADVIVTAPVLRLFKRADKDLANPGDQITYTIQYQNTGTGVATNVVIKDAIPPDTTFVSSTPPYDSVMGDTYTWNIGQLDPGEPGSITIVVEVDVGTPDKTLLRNEVALWYADANGNPYPRLWDYADVWVTAPVMDIEKRGPAEASPGEPFTYYISYKNSGTGNATNVKIVDVLPDEVNYVSATPAPTDVSGQTLTWEIGDVLSGEWGTISVDVTVDLRVTDGTIITNVATLYYADANGNMYPTKQAAVRTLILAGSIGDYVWDDDNMNGVPDVGEVGLSGIEIILQGTTTWGQIVSDSTFSDGSGNYLFDGLPPGDYTVSVVVPSGYGPTTPESYNIILGRGDDYLDADFGLTKAEIEKTVKPDVAKKDDIIHVTLTVKNPFYNGLVVDILPPELAYIGDGVDNDGDGLVDEEALDGIDNDGDGLIDEDVGNFTVDGAYITGGLVVTADEVIYYLPDRGWFIIEFDVTVPEEVEEEKYVTNIGRIVVDNETIAEDTADILLRYSGFDKYFVPIGYPPPNETGEIVVDGGTPGYFIDYGDGDGIIEVGELIVWLVQYNVTNKFNYSWHRITMEDRWGGEYGLGGDGADNDNDGLIDEELFNGIDDDGDGAIDEDISEYWATHGSVEFTLRGTPPHSDKVYIKWSWDFLAPGETALLTIPVFTDRNPGDNQQNPQGHQSFSSPGFYIMNSGGVLKYLDEDEKQHSFHTLRLYTNVTEDDGEGGEPIEPPFIAGFYPMHNPTILEGDTQSFEVQLFNPSGQDITVTWFLDGEAVLIGNEYTFTSDRSSAGVYTIRAEVLSGVYSAAEEYIGGQILVHEWSLIILDVNPAPEAVISAPASGSVYYQGETVDFDGSLSSDELGSVTYLWEFGDGMTSTLANPSHVFAQAGSYMVKLTVTDSEGATAADFVAVSVKGLTLDALIELPTKEIITEGTTLDFSGMALYDGYEGPFFCSWTFGDGASSEDCETSYYFGDDGTYTITFSVFDEQGHEASESIEITVLNVRPKVSVTKHMNGFEGTAIHFTATATDPGDDELNFAWDLGDGTTMTGNDFYHAYADDGLYAVTLTVTDGDGGIVVKVMTVNVKNLPPSANAGGKKFAHTLEPVFFSGSVSDPGVLDTLEIVWNMGDGTTIEGTLYPVHVYSTSGVYTVRLIVTDDDGAKTVAVVKVHVIESLETVLNPPTYWDDTTTPIVIEEDEMVTEDSPIPLSAIILLILDAIALAAGSYAWVRSRKRLL